MSECRHVYPAPENCRRERFYSQDEFTAVFRLYGQTSTNPSVWQPYGDPIPVQIKAVRVGRQVTLTLPGISVEATQPSYLSIVEGLIPRKYRPTTMNIQSFAIGSYLTSNPPLEDEPQATFYQGTVYRIGVITVSAPGNYPLPEGQFNSNAATVSYVVSPKQRWVDNTVVSTWGCSNAVAPSVYRFFTKESPNHFNFGDYEGIDMQFGRIATNWADNAETPLYLTDGQPGRVLNQAYSLLRVRGADRHATNPRVVQEVGPVYLQTGQNAQMETGIASSFVNPNYVATVSPNYSLPDVSGAGLLYSLSTDGGKTFQSQMILGGTVPGLPISVGINKTIRWDRFNNLWITFMAAGPTFVPFDAYTVGSHNGNPNGFHLVPGSRFANADYPWSRTGPDVHETGAVDGGRPEALWGFVSNTAGGDNTPLNVFGFQINGPLPDDPNAPLDGIVGPVRTYTPEITGLGGTGDIGIGPDGQVFLTCQTSKTNALFFSKNSQSTLFGLYNPRGLEGDFGTRRDIGQVSVGKNISITPSDRFIENPTGFYDLSNGPNRGRLYISFVDQHRPQPDKGLGELANPPYSNTANGQFLGLTWSDNNGITWADPIQVNNDVDSDKSNFNNAIAIDRSNGNVAIGFYSGRCDPGRGLGCDSDGVPNTDVNWTVAVFTTEFISEIERDRRRGATRAARETSSEW